MIKNAVLSNPVAPQGAAFRPDSESGGFFGFGRGTERPEPSTTQQGRSVMNRCRALYRAVAVLFAVALPAGVLAGQATVEPPDPSPIALIHVNLVPMTEEVVLPDHMVLVRGRDIAAVGPTGSVEAPPGTRIIDGRGGWLMPGLADMHIHTKPEWATEAWPVNPLKLYLAKGVTTVRCFGPGRSKAVNPSYVLDWRRLIGRGAMDGPTIYTSGPILYGPVKDPAGEVRRQKAAGYDFIKLYSYLTPEEYSEIMAAAGRAGMYTAGHIPFMVGLRETLASSLNEIAHVEELLWEMAPFDRSRRDLRGGEWIMYVARETYTYYRADLGLSLDQIKIKYRDKLLGIAELVKHSGAVVSSTLFLDELIVEKLFRPEAFVKRPENRFLPAGYLESFAQGREKHQRQFKGGEDFAPFKRNLDLAFLWALREKGVPVLAATDAGTGGMGIVPGYSLHEELRLLVEHGYTPYEALAAATKEASRTVARMTGRDEFGVIAPGRRADLVLVGGNPLADPAHAEDIQGVMAAGRWFDAGYIEAVTPR